ncbi:MAG: hypothetical protein AAFU55_14510, partial [Pseudomonadota bacterium]
MLRDGTIAVATLGFDFRLKVDIFDAAGKHVSHTVLANDAVIGTTPKLFVHDGSFSVAYRKGLCEQEAVRQHVTNEGRPTALVETAYFEERDGTLGTGTPEGGVAFFSHSTSLHPITTLSILFGELLENDDWSVYAEVAWGDNKFNVEVASNGNGKRPELSNLVGLSDGNTAHILDGRISYTRHEEGSRNIVIVDPEGDVVEEVEVDAESLLVEDGTFLAQLNDGTLQRFTNDGDLLHADLSYTAENLPTRSDGTLDVPFAEGIYLEDG